MSEQITTLKNTAKGKGKTSALSGLLNAGKVEQKTQNKDVFEKLLSATKKTSGVETVLDKNSSKLKNTETKDTHHIDESTLVNIKQLLSSIKLNDKLAIEKNVKELRDAAESAKNPKTSKELKKLLTLAEKADVHVKKISVETIKEDSKQAAELKKEAPKLKTAESDAKPKLTEQVKNTHEQKLTEQVKNTHEQKHEPKEVKTEKKEIPTQQPTQQPKTTTIATTEVKTEKKEIPSLAGLLQGNLKQDDKKTEKAEKLLTDGHLQTQEEQKQPSKLAKEIAQQQQQQPTAPKKKEEQKQALKTDVQNAFKAQSAEAEETKIKNAVADLAELLKKETPKDTKEVVQKDTNYQYALDAQKSNEMDMKSKMTVAKEGLKNFSEDLKETIDNYKPPLMKVSMEMKPENLGSVDVTLITRGQNLIVNVSSTQDTMQMFMQNLPEFKANLMAQGFVSLQMNFNFSENKEQNNKNYQKEAAKKYQVNNDVSTKSIESLDIVMPHPKYA
jgi:flagellar hook-length control protein FliK